MKVNNYVRTKKGIITKIIDKQDVSGGLHNKEEVFILDNGNRLAINSCKVIKTSSNIIDLIEEGDYVNGRLVEWKSEDFVAFGRVDYAYEEDIKSIVTKEQFESMEYKVKE